MLRCLWAARRRWSASILSRVCTVISRSASHNRMMISPSTLYDAGNWIGKWAQIKQRFGSAFLAVSASARRHTDTTKHNFRRFGARRSVGTRLVRSFSSASAKESIPLFARRQFRLATLFITVQRHRWGGNFKTTKSESYLMAILLTWRAIQIRARARTMQMFFHLPLGCSVVCKAILCCTIRRLAGCLH